MAGAVQVLLWSSRAVVVAADLRARGLQRQRAEVDAGDADAGDRVGGLSSVSALHRACAVGRRPRLATAAGRRPRTSWRVDSRQHELFEIGPTIGRRCAAVLGGVGQNRQLQVAVTASLWTGVRAWFLGAALYLPEEWLTPARRSHRHRRRGRDLVRA